jgi:hypothetical protein
MPIRPWLNGLVRQFFFRGRTLGAHVRIEEGEDFLRVPSEIVPK